MKLTQFIPSLYQAGLGILVEIAYSAAIIAASFGVIFIALVLFPWSSNPR